MNYRNCKRLREFEEGKAVEVTVNSKEEKPKDFVWIPPRIRCIQISTVLKYSKYSFAKKIDSGQIVKCTVNVGFIRFKYVVLAKY